jgi:hypothetical protein
MWQGWKVNVFIPSLVGVGIRGEVMTNYLGRIEACKTMPIEAIKRRSHPRHDARVSCDMKTVCQKVLACPGQTVYAHYGRRISRSYSYGAFARATKYGLIDGEREGGMTRYYITARGVEFLGEENKP